MARGFLLHDPRVGKTPIACVAATRAGARRIAVLTRAIARAQWVRELERWAPGLEYWVDSYERATHNRPPWRPDVLVLDEAQRLKTPWAKRTRAVYGPRIDTVGGLAEDVPYIWALSGTLAPNHLAETWTHLHAFGRTKLRYWDFAERYCYVWTTDYGRRIRGFRPHMMAEYAQLIRPISRKRKFEEVFPFLPPQEWHEFVVDLEAKLIADLVADKTELELRISEEGIGALERYAPQFATQQRLLGEIKAPVVAEYVTELLAEGVPQIVVMARHVDVCADLARRLKTPLTITGATPAEKRADMIQQFQDGKQPVFVCQIDTANEAISLHAANTIVLAELPWSYGTLLQASQRIVKPEPGRKTEVILCVAANTIDEVVSRVLAAKRSTYENAFGAVA